MNKQRNSKKRKTMLAVSAGLALTIVAGSTFAWFSSKDEVTNRLSASANYGVSIAEDFTPPENWLPGQEVDKNVSVVNTGNVDAFVRVWLEGEMRVVKQVASNTSASNMASVTLNAVNDQQLNDVNLNYSISTDTDLVYLKELDSTVLINNPDTQNALSPQAYTEVMAVQAGGQLAYCPASTAEANAGVFYNFTPNESMSITNDAGAIQQIVKGTEYSVKINSTATTDIVVDNTSDVKTIIIKSLDVFPTIDSNTFVPVAEGLYIFRRNVNLDTTDDYEFSGYYVKKIGDALHYFALEYDNTDQRSDYVLGNNVVASNASTVSDADASKVKLYTAKRETLENTALDWIYDSTNSKFTVKKHDDTGNLGIIVQLAKANIGAGAEQWTEADTEDAKYVFYYNNDLEEGASTKQLVDSLTLSSKATQKDYLAFDFDLNVFMESVQVAVDADGAEGFASVSPWASEGNKVTVKKGAGTVTGGEITLIQWAQPTEG